MTNPRQQFDHVDVLRLEIESPPASGYQNMVPNPDGEFGGWGWITPVSGSNMTDTIYDLTYAGPGNVPNYFYTEDMPATVGQYVGASWIASLVAQPPVGAYYRARFEFIDAAGSVVSSTAQTGYLSSSTSPQIYGPYVVPATSISVRLRFDVYGNTSGGNVAADGTFVTLEEVFVTSAPTSAELWTQRANLAPNPSFETNTTGVSSTSSSLATTSSLAYVGSSCLMSTGTTTGAGSLSIIVVPSGTSGAPVTPGLSYTAQARARAASTVRNVRIVINWYNSGGSFVSASSPSFVSESTSSWTHITSTMTAPATAAFASLTWQTQDARVTGEVHYLDALMLEQSGTADSYFDGSTTDAGGWDYAWTGTAHGSTSTATFSNLDYTPLAYTNVIGPSHSIRINRRELDVGTLSAEVLDTSIDPATSDLVRPGRRCRVTAYNGTAWEPLFTGKISQADVTYSREGPSEYASRIAISAVDAISTLANVARPDGVGTMGELRFLMEGAGVPWRINGSGNQITSAVLVSANDNASLLDQIAITRDSNSSKAFLSRQGILVAGTYTAGALSFTDVSPGAGEFSYSDIDISFSTTDVINEVRVKNLEWDPGDPTRSIEVAYGPYRDDPSIREWGSYASEFTFHGLTSGQVATRAAAILAANKTPTVKINEIQVPILTTSQLVAGCALADLYDNATVEYVERSLTSSLMVTGIEHEITNEGWLMRLTFSAPTTVAVPQVTPSP